MNRRYFCNKSLQNKYIVDKKYHKDQWRSTKASPPKALNAPLTRDIATGVSILACLAECSSCFDGHIHSNGT